MTISPSVVPALLSTEEVVQACECVRRVMALLPADEEERTGGYFTICTQSLAPYGFVFSAFTFPVGTVPADKATKYSSYSVEKAQRVLLNPDDVSSFQSQDPEAGKWPGAARYHDRTVGSFSGLPWKYDEAAVLLFGVESGRLNANIAAGIAQISGNEVYVKLMETESCLQIA